MAHIYCAIRSVLSIWRFFKVIRKRHRRLQAHRTLDSPARWWCWTEHPSKPLLKQVPSDGRFYRWTFCRTRSVFQRRGAHTFAPFPNALWLLLLAFCSSSKNSFPFLLLRHLLLGFLLLDFCYSVPRQSPLWRWGCCAATILLYLAPTGQDARGGDPNASSLQYI